MPLTFVTQPDVEQVREARRAVVAALAARLGIEYRRALGLVTVTQQEQRGMTLNEAVEAAEAEHARRRLAARTPTATERGGCRA